MRGYINIIQDFTRVPAFLKIWGSLVARNAPGRQMARLWNADLPTAAYDARTGHRCVEGGKGGILHCLWRSSYEYSMHVWIYIYILKYIVRFPQEFSRFHVALKL